MLYAKSHNITSAPAFAGAFFNLSSSFSSQCHLSHRERQVFPHRRTIPMIPRLLLEEKLSAKPTDEVEDSKYPRYASDPLQQAHLIRSFGAPSLQGEGFVVCHILR